MQSQSPQPQPEQQSSRGYVIGIGIGLVPLILALVSIGSLLAGNWSHSNLFATGLGTAFFLYGVLSIASYVAVTIASIVCLCIKRTRYIGYGLLTMVFAIPVIAFIGCVVTTTGPHV